MRSFWTESQKKKKRKNNFSFLFYFLIKKEEEDERSPYFLLPAFSPSLFVPQHSGAI